MFDPEMACNFLESILDAPRKEVPDLSNCSTSSLRTWLQQRAPKPPSTDRLAADFYFFYSQCLAMQYDDHMEAVVSGAESLLLFLCYTILIS